jgi:hypothetical protein
MLMMPPPAGVRLTRQLLQKEGGFAAQMEGPPPLSQLPGVFAVYVLVYWAEEVREISNPAQIRV